MRNFDEYKIRRTVADVEGKCVIYLDVYSENKDVANIFCVYTKEGRTLIVGNIWTLPEYRRKGLGLLRIQETLKILEERNLQVERCLAADVEGNPQTEEAKKIAESFLESLGFERLVKYHWKADGETFKRKLEEKMQE